VGPHLLHLHGRARDGSRLHARIQAALKPGGDVLFDRPYRNLESPEPWPEKDHDKPNALPKAWSALQLVFYEDTNGVGDWQQTEVARQEYTRLRLVHMLARKLRGSGATT
jgi:hypothetical protein